MEKKSERKRGAEDLLYPDTWRLLKQYRDIAWELELAGKRVRGRFGLGSGSSIEDILAFVSSEGKALQDGRTEADIRLMERNRQALTLMDDSIDLLRTHYKDGDCFYWLLYYAFLLPQRLRNTEEVIEKLCPHIGDISFRTYYRKRKMAIGVLSPILWSCPESGREILRLYVS